MKVPTIIEKYVLTSRLMKSYYVRAYLVNAIFTLSRTFGESTKNGGALMSTLYERLDSLCKERGIKGGRMCVELGMSKSLMTDLKSGRKRSVNAETAQKIATYFGVSVGYLLGEDKKENPTVQDDGISENQRILIEFAATLSEEQAALALRLLRSLVEAD